MPLAVEDGVEDEVPGCRGLALGDEGHEVVFAHRGARVVGQPLRADRGLPLGGQVLAARRARPVRGEHPDLVRQGHQRVLHAVVQHAAEFAGLVAERGQQVRAPDVADEQGITGQHPVGDLIRRLLVEQDADRFRCVAGRLADLEGHVAQADPLMVGEPPDRVLDLGGTPAVADPGSGRGREFQVPGGEIGVEVRVDHRFDGEPAGLRVGEVLGHVAARVHDRGAAGGLVADEVGRLGQAVEVVLSKVHGVLQEGFGLGAALEHALSVERGQPVPFEQVHVPPRLEGVDEPDAGGALQVVVELGEQQLVP